MIEFELDGHPFIQLNDLLKVTGLSNSGGQAKKMIDDGLATVDGNIETRKRCKIREGQVVSFQGQTITVKA
ncbi:MAG: RNA-binding S4 domain-containing protein [Gammaproteobacteria bacterium]|nr:RNA-binding S4 domain-containing protein [Gammaproteobacteria bacterium]